MAKRLIALFKINEILSMVSEDQKTYFILKYKIHLKSERFLLFKKTKPLICCVCGIEPIYFALEVGRDNKINLNLYANKDGKEILFLKDRKQPKCKNNPPHMLQVSCFDCVIARARFNKQGAENDVSLFEEDTD